MPGARRHRVDNNQMCPASLSGDFSLMPDKSGGQVWTCGRGLREAKVDRGIARWINYMLRNRSTEVEWAGAKKTVSMTKGTSQGGVLSPLTWNTTIGGLLRLLNNSPAYVQAYADDIVILFQGPDLAVLHAQASDSLRQLDSWTRERNLSFSAAKSECMVVTWRRKWVLPPLLLRGNPIQRVTTVKYLGVTLDHKLSWRAHVTHRTAQAINVLCKVRRTLSATWGLSPKLTLWAYRALVLPLLEYGSAILADVYPSPRTAGSPCAVM